MPDSAQAASPRQHLRRTAGRRQSPCRVLLARPSPRRQYHALPAPRPAGGREDRSATRSAARPAPCSADTGQPGTPVLIQQPDPEPHHQLPGSIPRPGQADNSHRYTGLHLRKRTGCQPAQDLYEDRPHIMHVRSSLRTPTDHRGAPDRPGLHASTGKGRQSDRHAGCQQILVAATERDVDCPVNSRYLQRLSTRERFPLGQVSDPMAPKRQPPSDLRRDQHAL